jgi:hypothetical protein
VPVVVGLHPLAALWVYIGGWGLSAVSAIFFLVWDGLPLDWRRAFLEPCYPAAAMGVVLVAGLHVPSTMWGVVVDVTALALAAAITWWLEGRRLRQGRDKAWEAVHS